MSNTVELPSDEILGETYKGANKVDTSYWERLAKMSADEVCAGTGVRMIGSGVFGLEFLGKELFCHVKERCLKDAGGNEVDDYQTILIVLFYLQSRPPAPPAGQPCIPSGRTVTERQLPEGDLFFRGYHVLPKASLEEAFGQDPEGFLRAGQGLGGTSLGKGDTSFRLPALPCVEIYFILYAADDEFPAKLTILFSESITRYLPLDVVWALVNVTVKKLIESKGS